MNDSLAIQAQGFTKSYGKVQALRGVDLEVRRGEIFGFLGPNGSGKTTTSRCLLDLIRPDGGMLRVLGCEPQRESVAVRAQLCYLPGDMDQLIKTLAAFPIVELDTERPSLEEIFLAYYAEQA